MTICANKKIYIIAVFFGILEGIPAGFRGNTVSIVDLIFFINFDSFQAFNLGYLTVFMTEMIPRISCQILFGSFIYQHFGTANAYVFTRCRNRRKWFGKEAFSLLVGVLFYETLFYSSRLLFNCLGNRCIFHYTAVPVFFAAIILESFYIYTIAMAINLISILSGSIYGFAAGMGAQILAAGQLLAYGRTGFSGIWKLLFCLNPVSNMILSWHSSPVWKRETDIIRFEYPVWHSVVYFIIIQTALIVMGCRIVRQDIISTMRE